MNCSQCQQPLTGNEKFCGACGTPVARPKAGRRIPWRPVIIGSAIVLVLGLAGFLYFLQVTQDLVLWVPEMKPDEANAVTVANKFLSHVNAREFEKACTMNENSREYCTRYEVPKYEGLVQDGAMLQAIYANQYDDTRGYMQYTVVVKQTKDGVDRAYWLRVAPNSPEAPIITGPTAGSSWAGQVMRRLAK